MNTGGCSAGPSFAKHFLKSGWHFFAPGRRLCRAMATLMAAGKIFWSDPMTIATLCSTNVGVYPDAFASFCEVRP